MVINYPLLTEKNVDMIEKENKLVFVIEKHATKADVKAAVEELYKVKVQSVNISNDRKGHKKAFVRLSKENNASELAIKLNII